MDKVIKIIMFFIKLLLLAALGSIIVGTIKLIIYLFVAIMFFKVLFSILIMLFVLINLGMLIDKIQVRGKK